MYIKDAFFGVNKFNEPLTVEGDDAVYVLLVRLMLMVPGTSEINPDMGVGIVHNWRYCGYDDLPSLKLEIEKQISTYLPNLQGVNVTVGPSEDDDKEVLIDIEINSVLYSLKTDWVNNKINLVN